jgi:hypothetical protein
MGDYIATEQQNMLSAKTAQKARDADDDKDSMLKNEQSREWSL